MARHPSAIRQHRRSKRRTAVNKSNTTALRTQVKKLRALIAVKDREGAAKLLPIVASAVDQSVKKRTIHGNTGSRYKSRLSRQVNALTPAASK